MENNKSLLKSAEELCRQAELHRKLMCREHGEFIIESSSSAYEEINSKLRKAIGESITVIEDTKKAFKSKRLEVLRKKLIQVLTEEQ